MSKVVDIKIEVPDAVSEQSMQIAEASAREAAIVALQQRGELTIREAAAALELAYEQFLDLLAARGLAMARFGQDPAVLHDLRQQVSKTHTPTS